LASLQLAKVQVEAGELEKALEQLQWAQSKTKDAAITPLVTYRIARLMAETGNADGARAELAKITDDAGQAEWPSCVVISQFVTVTVMQLTLLILKHSKRRTQAKGYKLNWTILPSKGHSR
jgi:ATP/maltotriose-dependent transcriptional regulator MalT